MTGEPADVAAELRKDLIPSTIQESGRESLVPSIRHPSTTGLETTRAPVHERRSADGRREGTALDGSHRAAGPVPGAAAKASSKSDKRAERGRSGSSPAIGAGGSCFASRFGAVRSTCCSMNSRGRTPASTRATMLACWRTILGRELRGGVLAFDEYRHGHGRAESFLVYLLNLPGSSAFLWLGVIWALLYCYGRNVRLKPVEAYVEHERRTAQEYIDAVAQLYERARAAPLVVEAVARRLRQLSRSRRRNARRRSTALLQTAEDYVKKEERPASPTAAIDLVKQLIQLRKKDLWNSHSFMNTRAGSRPACAGSSSDRTTCSTSFWPRSTPAATCCSRAFPGLGKTLLAKSLARLFDADFQRIQFTPDLMPADILGTEVFQLASQTFQLRRGPIFTTILLADEINRAPPKTQAALLEVMEERSVSLGTADVFAAAAVHRAGDAEPDRIRRDLSAAGGAGRSFHVQDPAALSERGGRAGDPGGV